VAEDMTFLSQLISPQRERQIGIGVIMLALLLLIITLANYFLFWRNLTQPAVVADVVVPTQLNFATKTTDISNWHLFGLAPVDQSILPGTQLQAELTGVMVAIPDQFSAAIISTASQPSRVYRIGDTLAGMQVRVSSITKDSVVLDNGGHLEKLSLQRTSLEFHGLPKSIGG